MSNNNKEYNSLELKINYKNLKGRGGSFLITPFNQSKVFTRHDFNEEQKMFLKTAEEYGTKKILPNREKLNVLNKELSLEIVKELGELGMLGIDVPEEYDGLGLDKTTACIALEGLSTGGCASILTTISAHTGIAMLPIIWYGTEEQKKKYLPKMSSGEWLGCYALTEPNAGSDAMSGITTATLSSDSSHYVLNGQKIYITNAAWASVCVTFAKVNDKYTAFIIDKTCEGWKVGSEEKKLGIKGSSTCTVYFENCIVPKENILGKVGEGAAIAFNCLYTGRYKLAVSAVSGAKNALNNSLEWAFEREQFEHPISDFGMIQEKFANMIVRLWEADNLIYMTTGSIDSSLEKLDKNSEDYFLHVQKSIEDHAIEASICKVIGSECLALVIDESVQIYGGAGFIEEYPMASAYRDERINRIFEGTNEINRLIISSYALKKAILEEIPIRDAISLNIKNILPDFEISENHILRNEIKTVELMRSLILLVLNELIIKYGQDLKNNQWTLRPLSDMIISFSIMDTNIKFFNSISEERQINCIEVLKVSNHKNFKIAYNEAKNIIINEELKLENFEKIKKEIIQSDYNFDMLGFKKKIVDKLYKNKKYYLDK